MINENGNAVTFAEISVSVAAFLFFGDKVVVPPPALPILEPKMERAMARIH